MNDEQVPQPKDATQHDPAAATRAQRLRAARLAAGFPSSIKAARAHGWAGGVFGTRESGSTPISDRVGAQYASGLGVSADWLLFGREGTDADRRATAQLGRTPTKSGHDMRPGASDPAADEARHALARIRKSIGLATIADAAAATGWTGQLYGSHENGRRPIDRTAAYLLAFAFRVPFAALDPLSPDLGKWRPEGRGKHSTRDVRDVAAMKRTIFRGPDGRPLSIIPVFETVTDLATWAFKPIADRRDPDEKTVLDTLAFERSYGDISPLFVAIVRVPGEEGADEGKAVNLIVADPTVSVDTGVPLLDLASDDLKEWHVAGLGDARTNGDGAASGKPGRVSLAVLGAEVTHRSAPKALASVVLRSKKPENHGELGALALLDA